MSGAQHDPAAIPIASHRSLERYIAGRIPTATPDEIQTAAGILAADDRAPLFGADWANYLAGIDLLRTIVLETLVEQGSVTASDYDDGRKHHPVIRFVSGRGPRAVALLADAELPFSLDDLRGKCDAHGTWWWDGRGDVRDWSGEPISTITVANDPTEFVRQDRAYEACGRARTFWTEGKGA